MLQLTPDFTAEEFSCKCGKCNQTGDKMDKLFIAALQQVRTKCNFPFVIISGLRCPEHNSAIGGAPDSLHLRGRAADIEYKTDFDMWRLMKYGMAYFQGIGVNNGSIHLDNRIRPRGWNYYNLYEKKK